MTNSELFTADREFSVLTEIKETLKSGLFSKQVPRVGVVLGSGLGQFPECLDESSFVEYSQLPHLPQTTVQGHSGRIYSGSVAGVPVVVASGRFHSYEGYSRAVVVRIVRVMKLLGVNTLILTNAAGALNPKFRPGNLMLIQDHINLTGGSPLWGPNLDPLGPRFPDMTNIYTESLIAKAQDIADSCLSATSYLQMGTYVGLSGPQYETPAEIRMLRQMGGDAVGMSTVPEAIAARHAGMSVLGISCITNMGAGISSVSLSHKEVIDVANQASEDLKRWLQGLIPVLG